MKLPTIKLQSGVDVSHAAFLLKMTSFSVQSYSGVFRQPRTIGILKAGTPSSYNHKEERHER